MYVFGFFESSILHSSFAIEYALTLKLNETLTAEQKHEIATKSTGLGLDEAIKKSRGVLIDEELAEELRNIKNLRDMSAHPSNWITLYNQINEMFNDKKTVAQWINKATNQSPKGIAERLKPDFNQENALQAVENLKAYKDERWGSLPDIEWATHKKTLDKQVLILKKHSEKMIKDMVNKKDILKLTANPNNASKYLLTKYRYPEELALNSIHLAHRTLKQLNIL